MVVVPILAALGVRVPKTSSRAITSPAGTADTMGVLAEVALAPDELRRVVEEAGGCIAWGGAVHLAPADDILITVERPMEIDTEVQMVASILSKKKTAGASHVLLDIPVGPKAKIRTSEAAERLADLFRRVAQRIGLQVDIVQTEARGPVGRGIGPRLEALDVLEVLNRRPEAPVDLREKSLYLASRLLEMVGAVPVGSGYRVASETLDSGRAAEKLEQIRRLQGYREVAEPAPFVRSLESPQDGRLRAIDCLEIARVAKYAGAPAHVAAGVRTLRDLGEVVEKGESLFEVHAQSRALLDHACHYATPVDRLVEFGF